MTVSSPEQSSRSPEIANGLGALDLVALSAWCGLAAGELEVAVRVVPRAFIPAYPLVMMTRHFVWLVPLVNLALFLILAAILLSAMRLWPRRTGWLGPRILVAGIFLPALAIAGKRIYIEAWFVLSLGVAFQIVPLLERDPPRWRRWLVRTLPVLVVMAMLPAASIQLSDSIKQWHEAGRSMPATGSPNVLFIVLDTVRADHLGAYGYDRATTPALDRLAARGIRFEEARAPAPWTLASHASFFTGRWPHELGVNWLIPIQSHFLTLAEYLENHAYATAGFVANAGYCSYETGLSRGFTHFEDYILARLGVLRSACLFDAALKSFGHLTLPLDFGLIHQFRADVSDWFFAPERKSAARINRDFLRWLDQRPEPDRPFFVFLNYLDTHTPYLLPPEARPRFGMNPRSRQDYLDVIMEWGSLNKQKLPPRYKVLARDAYDDCIAYLDEQVGILLEMLQARGVLDTTLVVITSDHGEALGEHNLYTHGESLYRPEVRVPLFFLLPAHRATKAVVRDTVSLRDLPATVVDLVGLAGAGAQESPFPGQSLARFWTQHAPGSAANKNGVVLSELAVPNPTDPNHGRSPASRGPLISLAEGDLVYIQNQGDGAEELFNERDDPDELHNLAAAQSMLPVLRRFRDQVRPAIAGASAMSVSGSSRQLAAGQEFRQDNPFSND